MESVRVDVVYLSPAAEKRRLVKRVAASVFGMVRAVSHRAQTAPAIVQQSVSDIRDAWVESARPKA